MSGHTPGPWSFDGGIVQAHCFSVAGEKTGPMDGCWIAPVAFCAPLSFHDDELDEWTAPGSIRANARLIASAPDLKADNDRLRAVNAELLEALETIQAAFLSGDDSGHEWFIHDDGTLQEAIVAAIAKARGTS